MRVATSLGFAIMNLDGSSTVQQQLWLQQVRDRDGDAAARLKAQNLILNQLFFPKALCPSFSLNRCRPMIGSKDHDRYTRAAEHS